MRENTLYLSVFSPNAGKQSPEKTLYLNIFYSVLRDKMDSFSEYLQDVLTNKQHTDSKNMNILQQNKIKLQKQLMGKDKMIRSLV